METLDYCLPSGYCLEGPRHHYVLEKVLGKGGFGITYRGREEHTGTPVAVKEYFPSACNPQRDPNGGVRPDMRRQDAFAKGRNSFLNEAAMLKALDDISAIVRVLDFFSCNGTAYMVMEFLDGVTLRSIVEKNGVMSLEHTLPEFYHLMMDVSVVHQRGVLHRDIAPDNIMWMPNNTMKLMDFGSARIMENGRAMTVIFKPGFAPLEQYQTRGQSDYTDLYALCATMYYCFTGRVPPPAPERVYAINDNQPDPLLRPSALGISMPEQMENLLMWGLELDVKQRPQTVAQWAERVQVVLQKLPQSEPPVSPPPQVTHVEARHTVYQPTTRQEPSLLERLLEWWRSLWG